MYFPPELVPAARHPLVTALGEPAVRRLLLHRLFDYLNFTTELEQFAVMPVTAKISAGRAGLVLPANMREDAYKITTDEAWHAQFSDDMVRQIGQATGVRPVLPEHAQFAGRLTGIYQGMDADLRPAHDLVFATVSETLISAILSDLPRDDRLPDAVRAVIADHAEDEGRHHAYFRTFLRMFWPELSTDQRRRLGPWLPELVYAFLEPDYGALRLALADIGLAPGETDQVLAEAYSPQSVQRDVAAAAKMTLRYFAEVGALDDPRTADAFAAAGLLVD